MNDRPRNLSHLTRAEEVAGLFREAMAGLCSGVAVVTGRQPDGRPCGLLATSVSSFSSSPPSVMASISHVARSHDVLTTGCGFGVNVLSAGQEELGRRFAGFAEDKFAGVDWEFHDDVPKLGGALSFLSCRLSTAFRYYDHTLIVGDVVGGRLGRGDPLVYMSRSMGWRLTPTRLRAA